MDRQRYPGRRPRCALEGDHPNGREDDRQGQQQGVRSSAHPSEHRGQDGRESGASTPAPRSTEISSSAARSASLTITPPRPRKPSILLAGHSRRRSDAHEPGLVPGRLVGCRARVKQGRDRPECVLRPLARAGRRGQLEVIREGPLVLHALHDLDDHRGDQGVVDIVGLAADDVARRRETLADRLLAAPRAGGGHGHGRRLQAGAKQLLLLVRVVAIDRQRAPSLLCAGRPSKPTLDERARRAHPPSAQAWAPRP